MKNFSNITKAYLLGTMLLGTIILVWDLSQLDTGDFWALMILSGLASLALILKVEGATDHSHYNISFLVYAFSLILLGTPSAILIILISHLVDWAWHKYPWYIQMFNLTSYVIVMKAAGLTYEWLNPGWIPTGWEGILAVVAAMALFTFLNHLMSGTVLWLARGESFKKSGIFDFFPLILDFILLNMGAVSALVWMANPFGIILVFMPIYLIYTTLKVPALERKSETDAKTGLFNAKYFSTALENELTRANRFDRPVSVIMADLDLLRNINNTYGHVAGDEVLIGVAKLLRESVRDYDVVARFGGEEFAILIPESTAQQTFERVESIRKKIENAEFTVPTSVMPIRITMSFGVAGREGFNQTPKEIVHNADIALYHAKLTGRNRTSLYNKDAYQEVINQQAAGEPVLQAQSLEERIKLGDFLYQPNPLREGLPADASALGQAKIPAGVTSSEMLEQLPEERHATVKRSKIQVHILTAAMLLAALALLAILYRPVNQVDWLGLAVFVVIVVLAEWLSIDIYVGDTSVSTSAAPILAGTLLFGPLGAVVTSITFAAVALVKHRSPVSRFIFNASNQMIAGLLYLGIIQLSTAPFGDWPIPVQIILCLLAAGITYLSTTFLIAFALHLELGAPVSQVWYEKFGRLAPYYAAMGLIAYTLIFSYRAEGLVGTVIVLVPLLLLRVSQVQYIERIRTIVKQLREKNLALESHSREINDLNDGLFGVLAEAIDLRDPFVWKHSDQVSGYSVLIAKKLGLPDRQVEMIRKAGKLHDIGKLGVPDSILNKRSSLTPDEFALIKTHVTRGAQFLESFHALRGMISVIRHHHEHFDGSGYPNSLRGDQIPLEARIVCVADAVAAMASDQPERPARTLEEIKIELQTYSGTQFDPQVVGAMLGIIQVEPEALVVNSTNKWIAEHPPGNISLPGNQLAGYLFKE